MRLLLPALTFACILACALPAASAAQRKTENILWITLDGVRFQELFGGADEPLLEGRAGGMGGYATLTRSTFWRPTPEQRRATLMPFLWNVIAKEGQLFGDPAANCIATVTNPHHFSYPGYSEILCGFADPKINSNEYKHNPHTTLLEWLNQKEPYKGRVRAFAAWDAFDRIINIPRAGIPLHAGLIPLADAPLSPRHQHLNQTLLALPRPFSTTQYDVAIASAAAQAMERHKPRVLFVSFGESDEWAHARRYDVYLQSIRNTDRFIRHLWETAQSLDHYAGKTALVITTDHGRGDGPGNWTDHGIRTPGSDKIWIALLGPDTPALGIRKDLKVTQSQVAATVAALLGEDFPKSSPRSAPALPDILKPD